MGAYGGVDPLTIRERLQVLVGTLPDEASVTMRISDLRAWLDEDGVDSEGNDGALVDLTCQDVAEKLGRTSACVRAWCRDGRLVSGECPAPRCVLFSIDSEMARSACRRATRKRAEWVPISGPGAPIVLDRGERRCPGLSGGLSRERVRDLGL